MISRRTLSWMFAFVCLGLLANIGLLLFAIYGKRTDLAILSLVCGGLTLFHVWYLQGLLRKQP